ncbi:MAG TPA: hypothetical protein VNU20_05695 [Candidatus Sulfotelmatobacter sp.]|jgi:hypothetical protein|nr:hypothetical protein [Candidatus Sulfotelmatobacter sp.]
MGYSLSWAAIKNGRPEAIHSALGLRATGVWEEIPESKIVGASLPTGWYLVSFKRKELGDHILTKLSSMGEIVYCFVEDHVMFSRASGWKDGKFLWSVTHDCEKGRYHLEIMGHAPLSLKTIHAKLVSAQDAEGGEEADVDHIYDAPAELAKDLTGFRHDQDMPGMNDKPFQVLEKNAFLSRLFGGKN